MEEKLRPGVQLYHKKAGKVEIVSIPEKGEVLVKGTSPGQGWDEEKGKYTGIRRPSSWSRGEDKTYHNPIPVKVKDLSFENNVAVISTTEGNIAVHRNGKVVDIEKGVELAPGRIEEEEVPEQPLVEEFNIALPSEIKPSVVKHVGEGWAPIMNDLLTSNTMSNIVSVLKKGYGRKRATPKTSLMFNAFRQCPFDRLKLIVIGEEPRDSGVDIGLSFAFNPNKETPKSFDRFVAGIEYDLYGLSLDRDSDPTLYSVAKQGVLFLNKYLTVLEGKPGSHKNIGWESITLEVIKRVQYFSESPLAFIFLTDPGEFIKYINRDRNLVLTDTSPMDASINSSYRTTSVFSKVNSFLKQNNQEEIVWFNQGN